jgi:hypothetical protein
VRTRAAAPALEPSLQRALGARLRSPAAATLTVTLSENQRGPLLVAELTRNEESSVFLAPFDAGRPAVNPAPPGLTLEARLVWEQTRPILDLALAGDYTIVLEPDGVAVYQRTESGHRLRSKGSPPPGAPLPRDPRGRLVVEGDIVRAYWPGRLCRARIDGGNLACDDRTGDWPLDGAAIPLPASLAARRNFFEAPPMPPFYTAARWRDGWALATLDGQTRLFDPTGNPTAALGDWGTDIAALDSCTGERFLAGPRGGALEAFTIASDNRPAPVAKPLPLAGRLAALWPAEQPGSVTAVTHSPETGRYAAHRVSLACGR